MKKIKILFIFLLYIFIFNETCASNIDNINIVNNKNVEFTLTKDVVLSQWVITPEIKFLKDIEVVFTSADSMDQNKLVMNLAKDLEKNKTYSLLTILWPEANIDFAIWDSLEGFEISNTKNINSWAQWLNRILIKDSKTIELYFNSIVTEEEFEYKILDEQKISEITASWSNVFNIKLDWKLEKVTNYLVMVLTLKDRKWKEVVMDEDLFELKTDENLKDAEVITEEKTELKEAVNSENDKKIEADWANTGTWNLENVALTVPETPDTWTETNVLILFTFIINTFIFFRKKILK